jgi:hypothetical protein
MQELHGKIGHLIVHQRLETLVIFSAILLISLEMYFSNSILLDEITLDRNMTGVDDEVLALMGSDAER